MRRDRPEEARCTPENLPHTTDHRKSALLMARNDERRDVERWLEYDPRHI